MLVWLTLPFYDFCGFRSVAVNSVYKLQFFPVIADIAIFVLKRDDKLQLTDNCSGLTQRGQDMARRNENVFLMQQITDNLHASEIIQSSSLRKLPL